MKPLTGGVRLFQDTVYPNMQSLFEELAGGQKPHTMFITCADSRIDPTLITQCEPGELFVHRNAGNLVPEHGASNSSEAACIEYAVRALGVSDIVICGHSHCGAMAGLANAGLLEGLDCVAGWLEHASETARASREIASESDGSLLGLAERNVVVQLGHLAGYPFVSELVASGDLSLHGWLYVIETGEIRVYQKSDDRFVSIVDIDR